MAVRVIAAQQKSDHAATARFVDRHERTLGDLLGSVLALCAEAGLAKAVEYDIRPVRRSPSVIG